MGPVLVRTLLETKQNVPEFLQQFMPEGEELENLQFPSEQDDDMGGADTGAWGDNSGFDAGNAWGGGGGGGDGGEASAAGADTGNAWGGGGDTGGAWGGGGKTAAAASGGWETGGASSGGGGW